MRLRIGHGGVDEFAQHDRIGAGRDACAWLARLDRGCQDEPDRNRGDPAEDHGGNGRSRLAAKARPEPDFR
jgi:hypothetical protein